MGNNFCEVCMKAFWNWLSCWWFARMTPAYSSLSTIDEREKMRKRRLLSVMTLIALTLTLATLPLRSGLHMNDLEVALICSLAIAFLLTIWLNQRGRLIGAGLLYTLSSASIEMIYIAIATHDFPLFSLFLWPVLLTALISSGFFLPVWAPFLLAVAISSYTFWLIEIENVQQVAIYIPDPHLRLAVLIIFCFVIISTASYIAIFTATTNQAIIKADQAAALEQAHQDLTNAYKNIEETNEKLEIALTGIQKQALTDGLTGLLNHRAVMEQFTRELERARRYGHPLSIAFFDADHFKHINDTYGHAAGDAVLCQIGERALDILRSGDTLGRFGGEEFVVLLPETDATEAYVIAERIRATVAAEPVVSLASEASISVTTSIGLSTYRIDGDTEQELLSSADRAMYVAKRSGRNQVCTATEVRAMEQHQHEPSLP